jgi:hypothetical protein
MRWISAALLVIVPTMLCAQERPVKTLLTEPGKLLHKETLTDASGKGWTRAKGKWEVVDGALRGSELKADMHGAAQRMPLTFTGAVIQYDFKLDGAKMTTLSINKAKGHLCRVAIRPDGFDVRKDKDKADANDKGAVLGTCKVDIKPGEWHTITIELLGDTMLASLDGKQVAFGAHKGIDMPKANLGLTVAGESASFRNLSIWEAQSNPAWESTRARLQQAQK